MDGLGRFFINSMNRRTYAVTRNNRSLELKFSHLISDPILHWRSITNRAVDILVFFCSSLHDSGISVSSGLEPTGTI